MNLDLSRIGRLIFAIATVGYGILHFVHRDFIMGRAPAWPSGIPGQLVWACLSGVLLVILGMAMATGKKPRIAAILVAAVVFVWAFLRHIIAGHWAWGGDITNTFKALKNFTGALAIAGSLPLASHLFTAKFTSVLNQKDLFFRLGRIGLGAFMVISGIQHFMFVEFVSQLIPAWIPGKIYWTYFTGIALITGGVGLQLNKTVRLAAILSGIMIFTWFLILHIPRAVLGLGTGTEWIGVVGSLSTSGIAFVLAGSGKSNENIDMKFKLRQSHEKNIPPNMKRYIQHQAPIMPVYDLKKTLQYYRDQLGFEIAWIWEDGYGSVINREIEIHFSKSDTVAPQSIYFFVDDADKVYEFLEKQGVKIIDKIESKPWGMREFAFKDINGHILRIGHGEKGTDEIEAFRKDLP